MNPLNQSKFNHYMYLAVKDRKSANTFVGHLMSAEWDPYCYEKATNFCCATQKKDKSLKATEITKDDDKIIQDQKDVLVEVPNEATEKELQVVIDMKK